MTAVVVEHSVVASLPSAARAHLVVVPTTTARARLRRRGDDPLVPDALDAMVATSARTLLLARPPEIDAGAARLRQLAALLGLAAVRLPRQPDAAGWVAGVADAWVGAGQDALLRRLQVLAAAAEAATSGDPAAASLHLPVVRPAVLARWAGRAWRPCPWCRGGGLPARCGSCGAHGMRAAVAS